MTLGRVARDPAAGEQHSWLEPVSSSPSSCPLLLSSNNPVRLGLLTMFLFCSGKSSQAHARAAIAHAAATAAALPTAVAADPPMATARPFTAAALPTPMVDATATFPTTRIAAPKRQVKDVAVTSLPGPMTSLRDGRSHGHHLSASVQQAAQLQPTAAPSHAPWPVMNAGQNGMTRPAHVPVIPGKRLSCVAGSGCEGCSAWKRVVCDHASLHYMSPAIA